MIYPEYGRDLYQPFMRPAEMFCVRYSLPFSMGWVTNLEITSRNAEYVSRRELDETSYGETIRRFMPQYKPNEPNSATMEAKIVLAGGNGDANFRADQLHVLNNIVRERKLEQFKIRMTPETFVFKGYVTQASMGCGNGNPYPWVQQVKVDILVIDSR